MATTCRIRRSEFRKTIRLESDCLVGNRTRAHWNGREAERDEMCKPSQQPDGFDSYRKLLGIPCKHSQKSTVRKGPPPLISNVHLKTPVCDTGNQAIGEAKSETRALVWITGSAVAGAMVPWFVFLTIAIVWNGYIPKARFGPGSFPPELNRYPLINASIYTMIGAGYLHHSRGPQFASLGNDRGMLSLL